MNAVHIYLGIAVLALNAATAGAGLRSPVNEERFWGLAALAHGSLVVQVVTGFFLFTSTIDAPDTAHVALPIAGLAVVLAARRLRAGVRVRATAVASLAVVALGMYAMVTGLSQG